MYAHHGSSLYCVRAALARYIVTEREFPQSEEDLVASGLLEKQDGQYYTCTVRENGKQERMPINFFKAITILYAANVQNINLVDGKLYDSTTDEQVYLVAGPLKLLFRKDYERISLDLYEISVEASAIGEEAVPDDNKTDS